MEEGSYRRAAGIFPHELMAGIAAMSAAYDKMKSSDWSNPDAAAQQLFSVLARYDYQSMYSKLMARCIMYWLAPEEIRKDSGSGYRESTLEVGQKTERAFEVLWIAYERWLARGLGHQAEVMNALSKFYAQLRWGMFLQQSPEGIPPDLEKKIAEEAYFYLVEVQSLVERSYSLFKDEMQPMVEKLKEINAEIAGHEARRTGQEAKPTGDEAKGTGHPAKGKTKRARRSPRN
jgi:hypothetical protein